MRCGTARRLLWPGAGPQAVTVAVGEAEAHLRACEACRHFLADQRALADEIQRLAPGPVAPAAMRERVFDRLARERVHQPARWGQVGRAAGLMLGAAAILAISVWVMRSEPADVAWQQQLVAVAEDHVRSAHEESIASTDAQTVQQWLSGRVAFAVHIPMVPDAAFEGARLCYLDGRRGAVLRYQVDGREVSYYIMPAGPSNLPPPTPERFLRGAESGYQVVAWHDAGLVHALVGNLPEARLIQLARFCVNRPAAGSQPVRNSATVAASLRGVVRSVTPGCCM